MSLFVKAVGQLVDGSFTNLAMMVSKMVLQLN